MELLSCKKLLKTLLPHLGILPKPQPNQHNLALCLFSILSISRVRDWTSILDLEDRAHSLNDPMRSIVEDENAF